MASDSSQEQTPLERALKERKELQDTIRVAAQKLEKVEQFIAMFRQYTTGAGDSGALKEELHLESSGWMGQEAFGQLVRATLLSAGRPMESPEIVEKFEEQGHPLGRTNVIKQTWNKLWLEKKAGNLVHLPKLGYWLPNEPLTEEAKLEATAARTARIRSSRQGPRKQPIRTGNPKGRRAAVSDEQLVAAENWLLNDLPKVEIARRLGISPAGVKYQFPDGKAGVLRRREMPVEELTKREAQRERAYLRHVIAELKGEIGGSVVLVDGLQRLGTINVRFPE